MTDAPAARVLLAAHEAHDDDELFYVLHHEAGVLAEATSDPLDAVLEVAQAAGALLRALEQRYGIDVAEALRAIE